MNRRVIVAPDLDSLALLTARVLIEETALAISERGKAALLVGGGTSVRRTYEALGKSDKIDWSKVFIFWGDERFVEPENPYSNYALVRDSLLVNAKELPVENVFPIKFDAATPTVCADEYSNTIREFFQIADGEWPVFDLALNGMGPDGHTASLFPHTPAVDVDDKIVVSNHAGLKPWVDRITLTFPVFDHARTIIFLTSGPTKTEILKVALEGAPSLHELPAAHVRPVDGKIIWLVDRAAAANLSIPVESEY